MPQSVIPPTCTHERRPGTTTCLYCLQEERARTASRRKRQALRGAAALVGVAAVVALAIVGISRIDRADAGDAPVAPDSGAAAPVVTAPPPRPTRRPPLEPVIARGSRDLGDGVVATRTDDEVVVNFDTDLLRTRFDWKFEAVLRSTLPRVFGDPARVALDSVPTGRLVQGDITGDLAQRGIPIALPGVRADTVVVWPVTRPGRDGPIVVAYRAESR